MRIGRDAVYRRGFRLRERPRWSSDRQRSAGVQAVSRKDDHLADTGPVDNLSLSDAAALVFAGLEAELETPAGDPICVQATSTKGTRVWGTAPRLRVAEGMMLQSRVVRPEDTSPWVVAFEIEAAQVHTTELAHVRLRVVSVRPDPTRRRNVRVPTGGVAWLTAVNCLDVVDGDRVDGTIVDLSHDGLAFATTRVLRSGDRLLLRARFFADQVDAEIRVTSARPSPGGRTIAGCTFIHIDPPNQHRIDALISTTATIDYHNQPPIDLTTLRQAANSERQAGWRRFLRR